MSIDLKTLSQKAKGAWGGLVDLKAKDGAMYKRTLLCRTGDFDGMYGPCTVTEELLRGIAQRYNKERAKPQNENDYAPILIDHNRSVDLIKGRVMADMEVEPWRDPDTGEQFIGLYGSLRVDLPEAQEKVDSGQYAHVSISFDEETFEFYELSFVAVEAARRSIVLSKPTGGTNMELGKRLSTLAGKHQALAAIVKKGHEKRQVRLAQAAQSIKATETTIQELSKKIAETSLKLKTSQIKVNLSAYVKAGKMTPKEFQDADLKALSAMEPTALKMILGSYEARAVSPDLVQFGQGGDNAVKDPGQVSAEKFRELAKLQREGKGGIFTNLDNVDDKSPEAKKLAEEKDKPKDGAMDHEEMKKVLDEMDAHHKALMECHTKLSEMHKAYSEMAEDDKEDESKEKEQMSSEDGKE